MPPYRVAALASHPIQYQAPLFRALAAHPEVDLHVFFCERWGATAYPDPGFRVNVSWDIPLLEGYPSTFLPNRSPFHYPSSFWGVLNPGVFTTIRRGGFHALMIHGWALASNWIAWAAAPEITRILLRGETNGLAEPTGLKGAGRRLLLKKFFRRTSAFLAIGTRNASFYRSYGVPAERIFSTPYSVDNEFFMRRAEVLFSQKKSLRRKNEIPPDLPVILFCGKLTPAKRPVDLLDAFASLPQSLGASLVFVGDGVLRSELETTARKKRIPHVFFLGSQNQSQMPACYAMADVLVLPSEFEPWGLAVNEAMCCGLPIIASDQVGAAVDLIREGINGFIYPAGKVEALADCLRKVLDNESIRRQMGRQSRELIRHWGIPECVEGILQALHSTARSVP